jgi:hypothetical protein
MEDMPTLDNSSQLQSRDVTLLHPEVAVKLLPKAVFS